MNTAILFRSVGTMILLLGVAMGLCVSLGLVVPADPTHSAELELDGWMKCLGSTLGAGVFLLVLSVIKGRDKKTQATMRRREAMALVGLGWLVCSVVVSLPYVLCAPHESIANALFEGVSGLTTTGATVFIELEKVPQTILLWRSLTQWVGGMGILAMFVVVLSGMTASSKTLIGAESSLSNSDLSSLRETMRRLWALYFMFTVACGLGLWLMGLTAFQAISHALTCVSTGGFGTENASIAAEPFTVWSKVWLILFMILGAICFPLYLTLGKRPWREIRERFEEVWWFLGIVCIVCMGLLIQHWAGRFDEEPIDIIFNVVSVGTSTGYASSSFGEWSRLGVACLFILMIVGGCSGSTSGGMKVSRVILWMRFARVALRRSFRPQEVAQVRFSGRVVPENTLEQLFLVLSFFGFFGVTGTLIFQALEPGHTLLSALSGVISCLGNIGPALGDMHPGDAFFKLGPAAKILCVLLMILGRLEYVALLVLFTRRLWQRY